uniref:Nicotinamide N-methyltransferase n=1 Tax=Leptobrachium leishanense TaxID=445787 RepID=A0A8C5R986_9ANUR
WSPKYFSPALIKGGTLINLSTGATVFHLLPICTLFEDIIILELNECCLEDTKKWLHKEQGCFDWSHASKILAVWEGCSDNWEAKEDDLRSRVKLVIKSDFKNENPTDPVVLQKADCVISLCVMGHVAKDRDAYCQNLKKLSKMLKLGGYLLLIGVLNASHFCVGEHKYQILKFNEEDIKKSLTDHGFSIEYKEVMESKIPNDVLGYEHIFFICAAKKQEL